MFPMVPQPGNSRAGHKSQKCDHGAHIPAPGGGQEGALSLWDLHMRVSGPGVVRISGHITGSWDRGHRGLVSLSPSLAQSSETAGPGHREVWGEQTARPTPCSSPQKSGKWGAASTWHLHLSPSGPPSPPGSLGLALPADPAPVTQSHCLVPDGPAGG